MTKACDHCGTERPAAQFARCWIEPAEATEEGLFLCHPDDVSELDCYHLVTVEGETPGSRKSRTPRRDEVIELSREVIELPRAHSLAPRRWLIPNGYIIGEAVHQEAIELLKSDPDEYFRRTAPPVRAGCLRCGGVATPDGVGVLVCGCGWTFKGEQR